MTKTAEPKEKIVRVTQIKSGIGETKRHKGTLRALGLHHMHETVTHVELTDAARDVVYRQPPG